MNWRNWLCSTLWVFQRTRDVLCRSVRLNRRLLSLPQSPHGGRVPTDAPGGGQPSSLSLVEIYKQRCAKKGIEHDNPISATTTAWPRCRHVDVQASHQVRAGAAEPWASAKGHSLQQDRDTLFIQPCRSSESFPQSSSEM